MPGVDGLTTDVPWLVTRGMWQANRLPQVSQPVCSCIHNTRHRHSALNEQGNVSTITCGQLQNIHMKPPKKRCASATGLDDRHRRWREHRIVVTIHVKSIPHGNIVSSWGYCVTLPYLYRVSTVKWRGEMVIVYEHLNCVIYCLQFIDNIASTSFEVLTACTWVDKDTSILGYEFMPICE